MSIESHPRFRNLAADRSLWKGRIEVSAEVSGLQFAIKNFLGEEVEELRLDQSGLSSSKLKIEHLRKRCPKLEKLTLYDLHMVRWPSKIWSSLRELRIVGSTEIEGPITLPNLEYFFFSIEHNRDPFPFPDVSQCPRLHTVDLGGWGGWVSYLIQPGHMPFPKTLKQLKGYPSEIYGCDRASFINHFDNCEISPMVQFHGYTSQGNKIHNIKSASMQGRPLLRPIP